MAKLIKVALQSVPEYITVGDEKEPIIVTTEIEFHPLDIEMQMEYILHVFIYDTHGDKDIPVFLANWDNSTMFRVVRNKRKDDFLCKSSVHIKRDQLSKEILKLKTPLTPRLGELKENTSVYSRTFEVFATLRPAIDAVSKWSAPFESKLVFT